MRYDLNLIGMVMAVTEDHIPLLHEVRPGNLDESEVFERTVESLAMRLTRLHLDIFEMIVIMDKGPNSEDNLAKVTEWMHVMGTLPANMAPDLMDLDLDHFSPLHATGLGHPLLGYLTQWEVYGETFNLAVTYNPATSQWKAQTLARREVRSLKEMAKLKAGHERTSGKQVSYPRAARIAAGLVHKGYEGILKYTLTPAPKRLEYTIDGEVKARFLRRAGRRKFFTDLDLDAEAIARIYEERTMIEVGLKWMKGDEMMPRAPYFVRTDQSILAHSFMALMGMLLWRLTWMRIRKAGISAGEGEVLEALDNWTWCLKDASGEESSGEGNGS